MAEDSAQEKTEQPTAKRLEKAKDDGQVPRSKELTTTAVLLLGSIGLLVFGDEMTANLMAEMAYNFQLDREAVFDTNKMVAHLVHSFYEALKALIPLFVLLAAAAIAGPIALGGWLFSGKSIAPKFNRMDPIAGLKRMFSMKSLIELVKAIGKVSVVIVVAFLTLVLFQDPILGLSQEGLREGVADSLHISVWAAIIISSSTILIALIDIPFQIWDHTKKLRMSKQDIKDEMKDSEGKPEVKGRIRQLQREMANQRMMDSVPEADVVITNPTHFSVALKYNPDNMETPILLAKGVDHMALKIREVAKLNGIERVQAPVLARAIFHTTDLDSEIPGPLYLAVAQVLAYVFQLKAYRKGQGERPELPRHLPVPKDMHY